MLPKRKVTNEDIVKSEWMPERAKRSAENKILREEFRESVRGALEYYNHMLVVRFQEMAEEQKADKSGPLYDPETIRAVLEEIGFETDR